MHACDDYDVQAEAAPSIYFFFLEKFSAVPLLVYYSSVCGRRRLRRLQLRVVAGYTEHTILAPPLLILLVITFFGSAH